MSAKYIPEDIADEPEIKDMDQCLEVLCALGCKPVSSDETCVELKCKTGHVFLVRKDRSYRLSMIESDPRNDGN